MSCCRPVPGHHLVCCPLEAGVPDRAKWARRYQPDGAGPTGRSAFTIPSACVTRLATLSRCGQSRTGQAPPSISALVTMSSPLRIRRALRWILELDRDVPVFDGEALQAEVERHYRWNLTTNVAEVALFFLGTSFVAATTILPLFVSKLTSSTLAIGVLALLAQGGWSLPQIFTAHATERVPRMLPILVRIGLVTERLPVFVLVLAASLAVAAPSVALVLTLGGFAWHTLGAGAIAPAWQELVGRCFPVDRRGFFMGFGSFVGTGFGALGAIVSAALLAALPYPRSFVAVFAIGATSILISLAFLTQVREPVPAQRPAPQSNRDFWAGVGEILRTQRNFRGYLGGRILVALGGMGVGFITLSALRQFEVHDATVGVYTGLNLLGEALGMLALGLLADRRGHKLSLEIAALAYAIAFGLAAWAPTAAVFCPVFVLVGFGLGGLITSGIMMTLEFATPGRQPTFAGLAGMAAPIVGAWLADRGFVGLFVLSAALNLAGLLVLRFGVADPRHLPVSSTGSEAD
jgi:MFS family permease